jgi:hypothetical protein
MIIDVSETEYNRIKTLSGVVEITTSFYDVSKKENTSKVLLINGHIIKKL